MTTHWFAHASGIMVVKDDGPGQLAMLGRGTRGWRERSLS